jgi:hypothetical protein
MALLDITELRDLPVDANGRTILCAKLPAVTQQQVTFTTTTASAAFSADTRFVRVHTDSACRVAFGDAPTATTTSMRMAAGQTEFFAVPPGSKVAAVTTT